ncbi:MAG: UDP-N-acetylmuramoyl-tripeptide--D-alanyl-D-alanine ligase, partial [Alphaproteobacteria bacterium]
AAAGGPLLLVRDTLEGLQGLGAAARARSAARIAAVTGSVGKTGVKEALALVLGRQAETHASLGNLNNHWGAPLSLARLAPAARYGIFELGMNHAGEIAPLSRLVRPHVAVITTIAPAHAAHFPSVEAIADAKAEIFAGVEAGGVAVLNRDNPYFERLADAARRAGIDSILGFGADPSADARLVGASRQATGSDVEAEIAGRRLAFRIGAPGAHWVANSLAVLAAVHALGADVAAAAAALADMRAPGGRGRRHCIRLEAGSFTLIDESYNASPAAMRAALEVLSLTRPGPGGRRIAILGDMLELGADAPRLHAELADEIGRCDVDLVYATGAGMAHLYRALPPPRRGGHAEDSAALAPVIASVVRAGDIVLVKGSLGMNMARIVRALAPGGARGDGG